MEAAVGQQYLALRQELQQAEEERTAFVRQEARRFAEGTRAEFAEEVHHHQIAQAQAQSLLAAERQHHEAVIEEQADRWQNDMDLVTEGAEEAHLEEVTKAQETVAQSEQVWDEWMITQHQLRERQRWYEVAAPIERRELEAIERREMEEELWERLERADAEAAEQNAAKAPTPLSPPIAPLPPPPAPAVPVAPIPPSVAGALPAPITPAAFQNADLNARALPPRNLPFVHFDPRALAQQRVQLREQEQWEQREEEAQAEEAQEQGEELYAQALQEQEEARAFMEGTDPASSHAMAYPAMAPMMPLGAFQPQQPLGLINGGDHAGN